MSEPLRLPRPKRGLSPETFYLEYVPQLWAAVLQHVPAPPWSFALGVLLDLRGRQHHYALTLRRGALEVREGRAVEPLVSFSSDLDSWGIAMFELLPRLLRRVEERLTRGGAELGEHLRHHAAGIDPAALARAPGALHVDYEDDAGDRAHVIIEVGQGGTRRADLAITDDELWKLVDSGARLSQLVRSKLTLSGDIAWLLELARLFEPASACPPAQTIRK